MSAFRRAASAPAGAADRKGGSLRLVPCYAGDGHVCKSRRDTPWRLGGGIVGSRMERGRYCE